MRIYLVVNLSIKHILHNLRNVFYHSFCNFSKANLCYFATFPSISSFIHIILYNIFLDLNRHTFIRGEERALHSFDTGTNSDTNWKVKRDEGTQLSLTSDSRSRSMSPFPLSHSAPGVSNVTIEPRLSNMRNPILTGKFSFISLVITLLEMRFVKITI